MKRILLMLVLIVVNTSFVMAEDKAENDENAEKIFHERLMVEVEKRLKKMGKNRIVDFSKELLKKEEELRLKELSIAKREEQLSLNEKQFTDKVKQFQEQQQKLLTCLDNADKEASKRVGHLVEIISGMKPEKAANILSVQDAEISVQILAQLEPAKVSKIFNQMDKEISARLQKQYMTMKR